MDSADKKVVLSKFKSHLLADKGMKISSVKVILRMINKILTDLDNCNPSLDDYRIYIAEKRENDYSYSYCRNICIAIEFF